MTRINTIPTRIFSGIFRHRFSQSHCYGNLKAILTVGLASAALLFVLSGRTRAQQAPLHLNPVVDKLAKGQSVIGTQTADYSMANCRSLSRINFDFVYLDMEHGVFDLKDMAECAAFMVDKAEAIKRGNAQVKVALFARFPPYGRDMDGSEWVAKQALDQGLMGVIFNGTDNAEQARNQVSLMRYPQRRDSKYKEPAGKRGEGPGNAAFVWGLSSTEYERHADLWPLNPEGDLLCIPMIETLEGLKNVDEIASVPGVGMIFVGAGGDLHQQLGVAPNAPEVEAAFQKILTACKAHNVACGITALTKDDIEKRLGQGWKMIRTGRGE